MPLPFSLFEPGQGCGFSNNITGFNNVGNGAYQLQVSLVGCSWGQEEFLFQGERGPVDERASAAQFSFVIRSTFSQQVGHPDSRLPHPPRAKRNACKGPEPALRLEYHRHLERHTTDEELSAEVAGAVVV